ncbi:hypothetical protein [Methanobrevibacter sp.]|uniref:hypothetical protein n=1 Tax=Methanobrevibacter sp. TaxID=66852 RepID=UPI00386F31F0
MSNVDLKIAMVISILFTGLGIAYAGNVKKGLILFGTVVVLNVLGMWTFNIFNKITVLIWIYGLYATYQEVQLANGE